VISSAIQFRVMILRPMIKLAIPQSTAETPSIIRKAIVSGLKII
jgi:hypothetical protein